MIQATLPWVDRGSDYYARLRTLALATLFGGCGALLLAAAGSFIILSALLGPAGDDARYDHVRLFLLAAVGVGPILGAIGGSLYGLLKQNPIITLGAGGGIAAGIVNIAIIQAGVDPYAFGILLMVAIPILGAVVLSQAGLVVLLYKQIGSILPRIALFIFLGGVAGLIVLPWLHSELFMYVDGIVATSFNDPAAKNMLGGELTITELTDAMTDQLGRTWSFVAFLMWPLQFSVLRDAICLGGVLGFINLIPLFGIWWERKVAGRIQSRLGPMRVGGWHGWAQSFADGIKLVFKEDFIPPKGDGLLFRLAPYIAFVPAVMAFIALPFGTYWVFRELDVALIFILAMAGVEVVGVIIAGWASNNKWSVYGAMREACQMVSYEIPMGMSLLIPVMVAGTLNLVTIVDGGDGFAGQGGTFWNWIIFANPFCFVGGLVYYVASLASCKRAPFDLPESESELVAGFHTEYSGFRWSLFFFAEYAMMYVVCGLCVILFLGGWHSGLVPQGWQADDTTFTGRMINGLVASGPIWFVLKSGILFFIQLWIRWTLPRIRIDQVLYACIQVLLPLTLILVLGNTFWILLEQTQGAWFAAVGGAARIVMIALSIGALLRCGYLILYGWRNNKRLVGTLVIDHLPGA